MKKRMKSKSSMTTITTAAPYGHGMKEGDWIELTVRDTRWWRRLWFGALWRGEPQRTIRRRVREVTKNTLEL